MVIMVKASLPLKTIERVLREAGAKRVAKPATKEFAKYLEGLTAELAKEAGALAEHSGRKTISEKDVKLARKRIC